MTRPPAPLLFFIVALASAAAWLAACERQAGIDRNAPPPDFQQRSAALIADFQKQLGQALQEQMHAGGPAQAIEVCAHMAPALSAQLSTGDLEIRRIGTRARNAATNRPTVAERAALALLSKQSPVHVAQIDGRWVYMQAIVLEKPMCLVCHGDAAAFPDDVKRQLKQRYPSDEAVDYKLGDLRGAFVVQQGKRP